MKTYRQFLLICSVLLLGNISNVHAGRENEDFSSSDSDHTSYSAPAPYPTMDPTTEDLNRAIGNSGVAGTPGAQIDGVTRLLNPGTDNLTDAVESIRSKLEGIPGNSILDKVEALLAKWNAS